MPFVLLGHGDGRKCILNVARGAGTLAGECDNHAIAEGETVKISSCTSIAILVLLLSTPWAVNAQRREQHSPHADELRLIDNQRNQWKERLESYRESSGVSKCLARLLKNTDVRTWGGTRFEINARFVNQNRDGVLFYTVGGSYQTIPVSYLDSASLEVITEISADMEIVSKHAAEGAAQSVEASDSREAVEAVSEAGQHEASQQAISPQRSTEGDKVQMYAYAQLMSNLVARSGGSFDFSGLRQNLKQPPADSPAFTVREIELLWGGRTWQDASEQFSTKARLVALDKDKVTLEREDKKVITVPLSRLSFLSLMDIESAVELHQRVSAASDPYWDDVLPDIREACKLAKELEGDNSELPWRDVVYLLQARWWGAGVTALGKNSLGEKFALIGSREMGDVKYYGKAPHTRFDRVYDGGQRLIAWMAERKAEAAMKEREAEAFRKRTAALKVSPEFQEMERRSDAAKTRKDQWAKELADGATELVKDHQRLLPSFRKEREECRNRLEARGQVTGVITTFLKKWPTGDVDSKDFEELMLAKPLHLDTVTLIKSSLDAFGDLLLFRTDGTQVMTYRDAFQQECDRLYLKHKESIEGSWVLTRKMADTLARFQPRGAVRINYTPRTIIEICHPVPAELIEVEFSEPIR